MNTHDITTYDVTLYIFIYLQNNNIKKENIEKYIFTKCFSSYISILSQAVY